MVKPVNWVNGAMDRLRVGSMVDQWRRFTGVRRTSAQGHCCSSTLTGEDEEGEAEPGVCSPEHEQRRRGGATAAESFSSRGR
jgi:hypothetical protein